MIKSAGLTSSLDRPIHSTDTPSPPHTGRLNNLCTISNMKEELLTLQSPPAPFPISLDCWEGYTASNCDCLQQGVRVCVCRHQTFFPALSQSGSSGYFQISWIENWGGSSVIGNSGQKWSRSTQKGTMRISNLLREFLFWDTCCLATLKLERASTFRLLFQPNEKTPDGQYNLNPMEWKSAGPELPWLYSIECFPSFEFLPSNFALSVQFRNKFSGWKTLMSL